MRLSASGSPLTPVNLELLAPERSGRELSILGESAVGSACSASKAWPASRSMA
jgi:hypothetical protein